MRAVFFIYLALALVLEPTLASRVFFFGIRPLLVLSAVVYFALVKGAPAGTVFGLVLGFVVDLTSIHATGLNMLSFAVVGFMVGNTWDSVYKDNALTQALILLLAVVLHETITFMVVTRLDLRGYFPYAVRHALPAALLTAATLPLLILGFERLSGRRISLDARRLVIRKRR